MMTMYGENSMLLEIKNLSFTYPGQTEKALTGVNFSIREGEFAVLCGASGCGKSTLLRQLKTCLSPHGEREGTVLFQGMPLSDMPERDQAQKIGFVEQSPENQIVTDKVWHELAFGLESLSYDTQTIRKRVAEMASFFGIEKWFYKSVTELSGGQKQLLNLASVMVMNPKLLILDEPTSQLDPIAASDFIQVIAKINRELGTTVIITEHRLEEAFPQASRVLVMEKGRLIADGDPAEVGMKLRDIGAGMFEAMPSPMRIWAACSDRKESEKCPVTVKEGREWIRKYKENHPLRELPPEVIRETSPETVICAEDVWFKYEKDGPDIVKGLRLTLHKGEFAAILGGNGTGKSTSLKIFQGILRPYRGKITGNGRIAALPQNPQTLFVKNKVIDELFEVTEDAGKVKRIAEICRLTGLLERHPYDLSGGEQERCALAKVLLTDPEILLLDEPTKGIDADFKYVLAKIIYELLGKGVSVLMVSHDVEFCARYVQKCMMFFDGQVISEGTPRRFFSDNSFYTTNANRMARGVVDGAVTAEDVMYALGATVYTPDEEFLFPGDSGGTEDSGKEEPEKYRQTKEKDRLPLWRRLCGLMTGASALFLMFRVVFVSNLTELVEGGKVTEKALRQLPVYGLLILLIVATGLLLSRKKEKSGTTAPPRREKPGKRTVITALCIFLLIPLTIFAGVRWIGNQNYYLTSFLVILECIAPFFVIFEGRKPQARELVILAVMSAMGVVGRLIFSMLPSFKPVIAVAVITGVALGAESGFLVGALTMLVSNFMMSQGPWTPWQMFSIGIIGFLAGVFYRQGFLRRNRESLAVFGAVMAIVVFGGIMNPASAVMWQGMSINGGSLLAYYITGFPLDLVNAAATFIFLWIGGEPILEKLDRVKMKYGLIR